MGINAAPENPGASTDSVSRLLLSEYLRVLFSHENLLCLIKIHTPDKVALVGKSTGI